MPLGTSYMAETVPFISATGVHVALTPAAMNATFGASNVKTATRSFSIVSQGHTIHFVRNVPHYCDAALLALLAAVSAPVL